MTADREPGRGISPLAHELFRHVRILHMVKARLSAEAVGGLDSGTLSVLMHVVKSGGMRQRDLADCVMLDPSTVSRHVALLVKLGHVARQADQEDGRAVRLIATGSGREVHSRLVARREAVMGEVLAGWTDDDLARLTDGLRRLNDDFESIRLNPGLDPFRPPGLHPVGATTTALPSTPDDLER